MSSALLRLLISMNYFLATNDGYLQVGSNTDSSYEYERKVASSPGVSDQLKNVKLSKKKTKKAPQMLFGSDSDTEDLLASSDTDSIEHEYNPSTIQGKDVDMNTVELDGSGNSPPIPVVSHEPLLGGPEILNRPPTPGSNAHNAQVLSETSAVTYDGSERFANLSNTPPLYKIKVVRRYDMISAQRGQVATVQMRDIFFEIKEKLPVDFWKSKHFLNFAISTSKYVATTDFPLNFFDVKEHFYKLSFSNLKYESYDRSFWEVITDTDLNDEAPMICAERTQPFMECDLLDTTLCTFYINFKCQYEEPIYFNFENRCPEKEFIKKVVRSIFKNDDALSAFSVLAEAYTDLKRIYQRYGEQQNTVRNHVLYVDNADLPIWNVIKEAENQTLLTKKRKHNHRFDESRDAVRGDQADVSVVTAAREVSSVTHTQSVKERPPAVLAVHPAGTLPQTPHEVTQTADGKNIPLSRRQLMRRLTPFERKQFYETEDPSLNVSKLETQQPAEKRSNLEDKQVPQKKPKLIAATKPAPVPLFASQVVQADPSVVPRGFQFKKRYQYPAPRNSITKKGQLYVPFTRPIYRGAAQTHRGRGNRGSNRGGRGVSRGPLFGADGQHLYEVSDPREHVHEQFYC